MSARVCLCRPTAHRPVSDGDDVAPQTLALPSVQALLPRLGCGASELGSRAAALRGGERLTVQFFGVGRSLDSASLDVMRSWDHGFFLGNFAYEVRSFSANRWERAAAWLRCDHGPTLPALLRPPPT